MSRRVVQVVRSDSFAGVERYICDVSAELVTRGWEVAVIGGDPAMMVRTLPPTVRHVPARTTAAALRALIALGPLPLVHAHMTAAEAASVLSRPVTRTRVVATRHFAATRGQHPVVRALSALLSRAIAREIAISRFVGERVGASAEVLLNGVPDVDGVLDAASRTVLVMQRLQAEKDTATALRAFAASGLADEGWRLVIAGRGPESGGLGALADELGVRASVELSGFVADPARLRAEAAIFLASAPAEPFGLSVVEAMAAALPVVVADGGAHREVVADAGLLFPPGDVDVAAALLRRLAHRPDERAELGRRARARQRTELSLRRHVDRLEELYTGVLG